MIFWIFVGLLLLTGIGLALSRRRWRRWREIASCADRELWRADWGNPTERKAAEQNLENSRRKRNAWDTSATVCLVTTIVLAVVVIFMLVAIICAHVTAPVEQIRLSEEYSVLQAQVDALSDTIGDTVGQVALYNQIAEYNSLVYTNAYKSYNPWYGIFYANFWREMPVVRLTPS